MAVLIALLRGVNVGGGTMLAMADFRAALERLGCKAMATYINSGNAVFRHDRPAGLGERISAALTMKNGRHPPCLVLTRAALEAALAASPYAPADPRHLHLFFLDGPAKPDLAALGALAVEGEQFTLQGEVFYLHAPAGIGRSKLAAAMGRHLGGVGMTARNLRTCETLSAMAAAL